VESPTGACQSRFIAIARQYRTLAHAEERSAERKTLSAVRILTSGKVAGQTA